MNDNTIRFTKMHGLGNDFVIINAIDQAIQQDQIPIVHWANRYLGIGFDQLLIIESKKKETFFCRIFNADGREAEQCGNGLRCVARFIHEQGLSAPQPFQIATVAGIFPVFIEDYDHIRIKMGMPDLQNQMLEISLPEMPSVPVSVLSLGNPHAILKVEEINEMHIHALGQAISTHAAFPKGVNVGFMQVLTKKRIRLRTFERGSGLTLACGSNACAAVFAGIINSWLNHKVDIEYPYGNLEIVYNKKERSIEMIGPATHVFSGSLP